MKGFRTLLLVPLAAFLVVLACDRIHIAPSSQGPIPSVVKSDPTSARTGTPKATTIPQPPDPPDTPLPAPTNTTAPVPSDTPAPPDAPEPLTTDTTIPPPIGSPTISIGMAPGILIPGVLQPHVERHVGELVTLLPGSGPPAIVNCPSGSMIVSGGFSTSINVDIYAQHKDWGNGWKVYAKNTGSVHFQLAPYAFCLKNTAGTTTSAYAQIYVGHDSFGYARAGCPVGSIVTGGGFEAPPSGFWVISSKKSDNAWEVRARNTSGASGILNVYAVCLSGVAGATTQASAQATVVGNDIWHAKASCPSGTLITGGGFELTGDLWLIHSAMDDENQWIAGAKNQSSYDRTITAYAICLSI